MTRKDADITNASALRTLFQSFRPDLVINAAALTHVDAAEKDETLAAKTNFHAAANIAALASAQDSPIIHLSTDFVFDGRKKEAYLTTDKMNPINHYGASKMMGEESLRHTMPWHVILRVSALLGPFGDNILTRTIKLIESQNELRIVNDRLSGPTPTLDLAFAIISIAQRLLEGKVDGFGTFHYCGAPACSRYELTQAIMEAYKPYTKARPAILPVTSSDLQETTKRPENTLLDCTKIKKVYGLEQPSWQEGLEKAVLILTKDGK
jgi:dTDP-4-dehydrorhamnose reductase